LEASRRIGATLFPAQTELTNNGSRDSSRVLFMPTASGYNVSVALRVSTLAQSRVNRVPVWDRPEGVEKIGDTHALLQVTLRHAPKLVFAESQQVYCETDATGLAAR
jgi:hypothetical protein